MNSYDFNGVIAQANVSLLQLNFVILAVIMGLLVLLTVSLAIEVVAEIIEVKRGRQFGEINLNVFKARKSKPILAYSSVDIKPLGDSIFESLIERFDAVYYRRFGTTIHLSQSEARQGIRGPKRILIEVMGFGEVYRRSTYATVTEQKVLQVILGECHFIDCHDQGEYWSYRESIQGEWSTTLPISAQDATINTLCWRHRYHHYDGSNMGILRSSEVDALTWQELEALLELRAGYRIPVVGEKAGRTIQKYVPSTLPEEVESKVSH